MVVPEAAMENENPTRAILKASNFNEPKVHSLIPVSSTVHTKEASALVERNPSSPLVKSEVSEDPQKLAAAKLPTTWNSTDLQ